MKKSTEEEKRRIYEVKAFLDRYRIAEESMASLRELNEYITDDISAGTSNPGKPSVRESRQASVSESIVEVRERSEKYIESETMRAVDIKRQVTDAIAQLDVGRGKTLIEKRFIGGFSWRKIEREMNISKTYALNLYRDSMIKLYKIIF